MVALVAVLVLGGAASVAEAGAAASLDATSFAAAVERSEEALVVEFYSPRCGTCKEFAPVFDGVVDALSKTVRFAKVDIDTDAGMQLAKDLDALAEGIPNVSVFRTTDRVMRTVWSGYEVPSKRELEGLVKKALRHNPRDPTTGKVMLTAQEAHL